MPTDDSCSACGRSAPRGHALYAGVPMTTDNRIGRYGEVCARKIVRARLDSGLPTYSHKGKVKAVRRRDVGRLV